VRRSRIPILRFNKVVAQSAPLNPFEVILRIANRSRAGFRIEPGLGRMQALGIRYMHIRCDDPLYGHLI
jgi:hypothetical protein